MRLEGGVSIRAAVLEFSLRLEKVGEKQEGKLKKNGLSQGLANYGLNLASHVLLFKKKKWFFY